MGNEEGFMSFEGGDDLPEEIKNALRKMLGGVQEERDLAEDVLKPTPEQFKLGPGDHCLVVNEAGEGDHPGKYDVVRLLDPEEYADEFPDWEERLINSYMFGQWTDQGEDEMLLGWIPRIKLVPIEEWQFDALVAHNTGRRLLDKPCDWLMRVYCQSLTAVCKANPEKQLPEALPCGECGDLGVMVEIHSHSVHKAIAGCSADDPNGNIYCASNILEEEHNIGKLRCVACDATTEFDMDETSVLILRS